MGKDMRWGGRAEMTLLGTARYSTDTEPVLSSTHALLFAALLLFATPSSLAQDAPGASVPVELGQTFAGRVVEGTDGDTYDVRRPTGSTVTIRLHGVDAPGSSQSCGRPATHAARHHMGGEALTWLSRRFVVTVVLWPIWRARAEILKNRR